MDDGEWVESQDGSASKVVGRSKKTDSVRGRLEKGDRVAASKVFLPGTKISMADLYPTARAEGWTDELFAMQKEIKDNKNMKNKKGLPGAAFGWENALATLPGLIQSWADYRNIANDSTADQSVHPTNKYERYAARLMGERRPNMYPVIQKLEGQGADTQYAINASGGLSRGQKLIANIANAANTRKAVADAMLKGQEMYNQYRGEEAQLMGNLGSSMMQANLNADQFNQQMRAKAHNARIQGTTMAKRNALDYLTQFFKNQWDYNQYDKMYKLYAQDAANRSPKKTNTTKPTTATGNNNNYYPNTYLYGNSVIPPEPAAPFYAGPVPVYTAPSIQDMINTYGRLRR